MTLTTITRRLAVTERQLFSAAKRAYEFKLRILKLEASGPWKRDNEDDITKILNIVAELRAHEYMMNSAYEKAITFKDIALGDAIAATKVFIPGHEHEECTAVYFISKYSEDDYSAGIWFPHLGYDSTDEELKVLWDAGVFESTYPEAVKRSPVKVLKDGNLVEYSGGEES